MGKKKEEKVDFDLSTLSLEELVEVYNKIDEFLSFCRVSKLEEEEEEDE